MKSRILICLCCAVPMSVGAQLDAVPLVSGLSNPLGYYPDPVKPGYAYVVQQSGQLKTLKDGVLQTKNFLVIPRTDLAVGGERGLLGFAFHPRYAENGYAFAYFTDVNGNIQVARFTRNVAGDQLNYNSRYNIINIKHPGQTNHNGGTIRFGPDGFLYIATGDGGGANDPANNAQNLQSWLGKMLRIDINRDGYSNTSKNYALPKTNPFKGSSSAKGEIWLYGLRNPYKFCFDVTGDIFIGDVGQAHREEIDRVFRGQSGLNFGWRPLEGSIDNPGVTDPAPANAVPPIFDYGHDVGQCIIGGPVYRGSALGSEYVGRMFFADYIAGRIWSVDPYATNPASTLIEHTQDLGLAGARINSIDETIDKELVVTTIDGVLYRIVKTEPATVLGLTKRSTDTSDSTGPYHRV